MKRHLLLVFALALMVPWTMRAQSHTAVIGNWKGTTSSALGGFYFSAKYSWTQTLYLENEVGGAGYIQSITFDNRSTASFTADSVKVYLGKTSMTSHPTAAVTTWVPMDSLTLVFSATNWNVPVDTGDLTIALDQPFYYDGHGTLVLVISKANSGTTSSNTKFGYTSTTAMAKYTSSSTESYCRFPTVAGTNNAYKLNVRFGMTATADETYCPWVSNYRLASRTTSSVTMAWDAEENDSYQVGYTDATGTENDFTPITVTAGSYTFDGLSEATVYKFWVRHLCGNSESEWQTLTKNTLAQPQNIPFFTDFENAENDGIWSMVNGANGWYVDSLGTGRALFVSNDTGQTNAYTISTTAATSWAWVDVSFSAGGYNIAFDWRCDGEHNYDYMRAFIVPSNVEFNNDFSLFGQSSSTNARNVIPAGWILAGSKSRDSLYFNKRVGWQHYEGEFTVATEGIYHVVFLWSNDAGTGSQPPAAVDSLSITVAECYAPLAYSIDTTTVTSSSVTMNITHPSSTDFMVIWRQKGKTRFDTVDVSSSSHEFTGLRMGTTYEGYIYTFCDGDTSIGSLPFGFSTPCALLTSEDLPYSEDFEAYAATTGGPINPCWTKGVITIQGSPSAYPYPSTIAATGSRSLYFYALRSSSANYSSWAALPQLDESLDVSTLMMEFNVKRYSTVTQSSSTSYNCVLIVGVSDSLTSIDSFVPIDTLDFNDGAASSVHAAEVDFSSYTGTGKYIVLYCPTLNRATTTYNHVYLDDLVLKVIPTCYRPTSVSVANVTNESVTLTWVPDSRTSNPTWQLEYGPVGFAAGTGTSEAPTDTTITISDLTAATQYEFRVMADCGDMLSEPRTIVVTTNCNPLTIPYVENFNGMGSLSNGDGAAMDGDAPLCWDWIGPAGSYIALYSATAYTYGGSGYSLKFRSGEANKANYLILPEFEQPISGLELKFQTRPEGTSSSAGTFDLGYMTNPFDTTSFVVLQHLRYSEFSGAYREIVATFDDAPAGARIAMRHTPTSTAYYWFVDEIDVHTGPSCPRPLGVSVASCDHESASIVIEDTASVNNYIVALVSAADSDTIVLTTNLHTFTQLTPATDYHLTVVSDCGDGTYTAPRTVDFRTSCTPMSADSLPYYENFEAYASGAANPINSCWTKGAIGTTTKYPYPYSTGASQGSRCLYFAGYSSTTTSPYYSYAAMPAFETPLTALRVNFKVRRYSTVSSTYTTQLLVGVMSNPNDITSFDTLEFIDLNDETASSVHEIEVAFDRYQGTGAYIAFLAPVPSLNGTTSRYNYVYLDSVVVSVLPPCHRPSQVAVDSVTANAAHVSWFGNGLNYTVEYADNADFAAATSLTVNGTDTTITGLSSYTGYYVRVKGNCGENLSSEWSYAKSFRTLVDCGPNAENILDTIGNLASTSNSSSVFYASTTYKEAYTAHIFTAAEMLEMGLQDSSVINSISLRASTGGLIRQAYVYLAETSLDAIETPVANDTIDRSTMTLVYSGDLQVVSNKWVEIPLNGNFVYNGNSNLLVCLGHDTTSSAAATFYYTSTTPEYKSYYAYTSTSTGNTTVSRSYIRPNIAFNICTQLPDCARPTRLTFVDGDDASFTFSWHGNAASYEVVVSTSHLHPDSITAATPGVRFLTANDTMLTVTGLEDNTTYYYRVRALCGEEHSSWSVENTFTTACSPKQLPYRESFESYGTASTSAIDPCWYKGSNSTTAYPYPNSTNAVTGNRSLYFYGNRPSATATTDPVYCYAALPMMQDSVRNLMLSFNVRRYSTVSDAYTTLLVVGVMSNPDNIETFEPVDTIDLRSALPLSVHGYDIPFDNYTGEGSYIAIYCPAPAYYGTGTTCANYAYVDDIVVDRLPSCLPVAEPTVSDVTTSGATVHWTGTAASYDVEYGLRGYRQGQGRTVTVNADSVVLTGLNPSAEYEVYVRARCSGADVSPWSPVRIFATACGPVALPFTLDPEDYVANSNELLMPPCWHRANNGNSSSNYYPYVYTSSANTHEGNRVWYYYFSTSSGYATDEILSTPEIDTANFPINNAEVTFWAKSSVPNRPLVVGVMENPALLTSFVPVDTVLLGTASTEYTVQLTGYAGQGTHIALKGYKDTNTLFYLYVDEITVQTISLCPRATNLRAFNGNPTTVDLAWTENGAATQWKVRYATLTGDTWTEVTVDTIPFTLTGLTPNTNYRYQVAPMCNAIQMADWSYEVHYFGTAQIPAALPYNYDFEDANEWANWQTATNNYVGLYRGTVAQGNSTNSLYLSSDNGQTHSWNMNIRTNAVAYRDIDFGPVPQGYSIDFDAFIGGTIGHNYDGIAMLLVDPAVYVQSMDENLTTPWGTINDIDGFSSTVRRDTVWGHRHTLTVDNVSGVRRLVVYHFNQATGTGNPYIDAPSAIDNISIDVQACVRPSNLNTTAVSAGMAQLEWQGDDSATYIIDYRPSGTTGTDRFDTVIGTSATLVGLGQNMDYTWWARKVCSLTATDTLMSAWSRSGSFYVPCGAISVGDTLREDFEDVEGSLYNVNGEIPTCWRSYSGSVITPHVTDTSLYSYWISGRQALTMTSGSSTNYSQNAYVALPNIAERTNSLTLAFWWCTESSTNGVLTVGYLTGNDMEHDFVPVRSFTPSSLSVHSGNGLQSGHGKRDTVTFEGVPSGNYPLAFRWYYGTSFYSVCLDDLSVWTSDPIGVCATPEMDSTSVTDSSITLRWTSGAPDYEVACMTGRWIEPIAGTPVSAENIYTFNGLRSSTRYFVGVRALCANGANSEWVVSAVQTAMHPCYTPNALAITGVTYESANVSWEVGEEGQSDFEVSVSGTNLDSIYVVSGTEWVLTNLTSDVEYTVMVRAVCESNVSMWTTPVTFRTKVCQTVTGVAVSNTTSNSAVVSWDAVESSTGRYEVNYGTAGFPQGGGTTVDVNNGTTVTLTGLDDDAMYDVYVRTYCAENVHSLWSAVVHFSTEENGINDVTGANIALYPNPAHSTVTLTGIEGEAMVTVVDMNGRENGKWRVESGKLTIDVSGMAQGAYFVRIVGEQVNAIRKLVVR